MEELSIEEIIANKILEQEVFNEIINTIYEYKDCKKAIVEILKKYNSNNFKDYFYKGDKKNNGKLYAK